MKVEINVKDIKVYVEENASGEQEVLRMINKCKDIFYDIYDRTHLTEDYSKLTIPSATPIEEQVKPFLHHQRNLRENEE